MEAAGGSGLTSRTFSEFRIQAQAFSSQETSFWLNFCPPEPI
jgi:hypothetical protein